MSTPPHSPADAPGDKPVGVADPVWIDDLPLFPLGTVLFPGGVLPLRVFETRYMDMVRACMHTGSPFGVCLITDGKEVGDTPSHESIGCLASILDWDMEQLGLLRIRASGGRRFEVQERRVQRDGLLRARVRLLGPDPDLAVPQDFEILPQLVRRIVSDLVEQEENPQNRMVAEPYDFDSATWVSNRLCEFLPIPMKARQKLMELDEPLTRLSLVRQFLEQRQVI
jgi:Lon protease-like protein